MPARTRSSLYFVAVVVVAASVMTLTAVPAQADEPAAPSERFHQGMAAYETSHWQIAFERFAALADDGHAEAARIALQMARFGPALYGQRFEATPDRRSRWVVVAIGGIERPQAALPLRVTSLETRP
jgi:hypothetical protein